ncbi:MAG: DUF2829 domain-containing protein [Devosiaceae bacterium]|nr:DUF2829 domain-containing protein [Devosiaceae bacterium]
MEKYIGTKLINAKPMSRAEYNAFRKWDMPADEEGADEGFLVEYIDGGVPNTATYAGYVSWSPTDVFTNTYRAATGMSFSLALDALKIGLKVSRAGWNGKNMFVFLVDGSTFTVNRAPLLGIYPEGTEVNYLPHVDMRAADGTIVPWLCSQTDLLANDWAIVD